MKIWYGFGTEHSANLVMIGHFKEIQDAIESKEIIDAITRQVREDEKNGRIKIGGPTERYTDEILKLLGEIGVNSLGPSEMEQFAYDFTVSVKEKDVILITEEIDVSAFFKVLMDKGARVEIYSAHDYPESKYGRSK